MPSISRSRSYTFAGFEGIWAVKVQLHTFLISTLEKKVRGQTRDLVAAWEEASCRVDQAFGWLL